MQTDNFRVTVVEECDVVEICGALKVGIESPLENDRKNDICRLNSLCLS